MRRRLLGLGDGLTGRRLVRGDGHGAPRAVDEHHRAGRHVVEAVDGDDARDPQLAGDDRGVAGRAAERGGQRDDERRVQTCGVGGCQVLGAQDRRLVGQRDTRFRQAVQLGDDTIADVTQVGDAFGHQPTELGEHVDELVDRADHRPHRGSAVLDALLRRAEPGTVLREGRRRGEHLGRDAARVRRTVTQPVGDGRRRRGEALLFRGAVGFGEVCGGLSVDVGQLAGPDHRCVLHPAYHGDTLQDGARRI